MLVGKRPRPQMKRTASMSGITVDVSHVEGQEPPDDDDHNSGAAVETPPVNGGHTDLNLMKYTLSLVSPRGGRRNLSALNHATATHFLRTCTFCLHPLSPARDIYMYMGDTAFCSVECRERKMEQEKRKEKNNTGGGGGGRHKQRPDCGSGSKGF